MASVQITFVVLSDVQKTADKASIIVVEPRKLHRQIIRRIKIDGCYPSKMNTVPFSHKNGLSVLDGLSVSSVKTDIPRRKM